MDPAHADWIPGKGLPAETALWPSNPSRQALQCAACLAVGVCSAVYLEKWGTAGP